MALPLKKERIFLVGLPGAGKSLIGKILSEKLSTRFLDLDAVIEEKEGFSIASIFENNGEQYFRALERKYLIETIGSDISFVLSTGGGAPAHLGNMETMKTSGFTVYLSPPLEVIANRLKSHEMVKRPMFKGLNSEMVYQKLSDLFQERNKYYIQSHLIIEATEAESITREILAYMKNF